MPLKLTARFVETVKGQERRQEYRDTEAKGLILRVMPSGVKSWALLYSHHRRKRRLTLGEFPAIKLAKARELGTGRDCADRPRTRPAGAEVGRAPRTFGCIVFQQACGRVA